MWNGVRGEVSQLDSEWEVKPCDTAAVDSQAAANSPIDEIKMRNGDE